MISNDAHAATITTLLVPGAKANTAAFTSAWVDARSFEGTLVITVQVGTVTAGGVAIAIEHASDGSGTGAAAIVPNEGAFVDVTTANDPLDQKRTVSANAILGWVRVVGTVTTGPVDGAAALLARPKNF